MEAVDANSLLKFAKENGLKLGWTPRCEFAEYLKEIGSRPEYHIFNYRSYESFRAAATPPPFVKTLLVLAVDYFLKPEAESSSGDLRVSSYSRACWHNVGIATEKLLDHLKEHGLRAEVIDVPARAAAVKAGLGFIGRNTLFYAHGAGSYVGISAIGTDLKLGSPDRARGERIASPACLKCENCVRSCPAGAIHADGYRIDPLKCVSFLNRHPEEPHKVAPISREALGGWLHGCEACQNCCPINKAAKHEGTPELKPEMELYGLRLPNKEHVSASALAGRLSEIKSPDFLLYVKALLGEG